MKNVPWGEVSMAICFALLMALAYGWERTIIRSHKLPTVTESEGRLNRQGSVAGAFQQLSEVSTELLQAVVLANPFSPQRREVPPVTSGATEEPTTPAKPPPAQFIYKGRVLMGEKQRAILEEVKTKKTYFLQVGQEVAGFQVLDISETQVVLSGLTSKEELSISLTPKR